MMLGYLEELVSGSVLMVRVLYKCWVYWRLRGGVRGKDDTNFFLALLGLTVGSFVGELMVGSGLWILYGL